MARTLRKTEISNVVGIKEATPASKQSIMLTGLAEFIALDQIVRDFTEAKNAALVSLVPRIENTVCEGAADKATLADVVRTFMASDAQASAQVQLKAKTVKKLSAANAVVLTNLRIPLRRIPGRKIINPQYAGGCPLEGNEAAVAADVVARLSKLIADNPGCGLPTDMFVEEQATAVPVEDALLRALKLPVEGRDKALDILSDVAVISKIGTNQSVISEITSYVQGLVEAAATK